jgi:hypothetical protein
MCEKGRRSGEIVEEEEEDNVDRRRDRADDEILDERAMARSERCDLMCGGTAGRASRMTI